MKKDAIIVGGGIIGCSIALRLAQKGLKVTLIERGRVGGEASRAAAGMLSPQTDAIGPGPFFDLCLRSRSMYRDFAAEVTDLSGVDVEYKDEGSLFIIRNEKDLEECRGWTSWQRQAGLAVADISPDELRKIEPALTDAVFGAIYISGDHQVENRRVMDALELADKQAGVEVLEDLEVQTLLVEGQKVIGVECGGQYKPAGIVVLAAGCWSGRLLVPLGLNIEVTPARGQMLALKGPSSSINSVIHSSDCYLVPRRDGRILIGSTIEYVGYRKGLTAEGVNSLLESAMLLIPALREFEIGEIWSGLRPDTADHLPIIGPSGIDNLFLATGHFRNGILLAPITAKLIAETIFSGNTPTELGAFSIDRFTSPMIEAF